MTWWPLNGNTKNPNSAHAYYYYRKAMGFPVVVPPKILILIHDFDLSFRTPVSEVKVIVFPKDFLQLSFSLLSPGT
jgi:hypothetical protein